MIDVMYILRGMLKWIERINMQTANIGGLVPILISNKTLQDKGSRGAFHNN